MMYSQFVQVSLGDGENTQRPANGRSDQGIKQAEAQGTRSRLMDKNGPVGEEGGRSPVTESSNQMIICLSDLKR